MSKRSRCRPGHRDSTNEARRRRARYLRRIWDAADWQPRWSHVRREKRSHELRTRSIAKLRAAGYQICGLTTRWELEALRDLCVRMPLRQVNPKSIIKRPDSV
jgi:hypothetical protein